MADFEKDDVPMLSETKGQLSDEQEHEHKHGHSRFNRFSSRTRSASISIPMNYMESYEGETNLVGHTGPLRSERKTSAIQMTSAGPLSVGHKPKSKNMFQTNQGAVTPGRKTTEIVAEKFPSSNVNGQNNYYHAGKNEHLLRSGQLGMCNDPYCTTCPTYHNSSKASSAFDPKFHSALYGDARGWGRSCFSFLQQYIPGVMNPHTTVVKQWNQFFVISCLVATFVDPLFFFLLSVLQDKKCIVIDMPMTKTIMAFRSMTDLIYFLHMLLQFRIAYVAPESTVSGAGELVDHPKKIALNYLHGYFAMDLFLALPLPQIIILLSLRTGLGLAKANTAKNLLRTAVLVQYIPRLYRFLPLLAGQSPSGFVFESAWANFVINLLTFVLSGHVVGSCWYLFGLQRVNKCLQDACRESSIDSNFCKKFIDCGHGYDDLGTFGLRGNDDAQKSWEIWKENSEAVACFYEKGSFDYGIYKQAVNITKNDTSIMTKYTYSLFWGFQQISTLAGNQTPSYFIWEVLFTMAIIGLGLLLFALLIGNMQNFLQALGRRRLEMSLRSRNVEQWMSHRRLPKELRSQVREAERFNFSATRGVNEEMLLVNLPANIQRDIRRHLFKFVKKVRIFAQMEDPVLDVICERLRQAIYIKGSTILDSGGPVDDMVFIVRGKIESIGEDGIVVPLSEGDFCGEELLTWCLEHSSVNKDGKKIRVPGSRLLSNRMVKCTTNVEAFSLRAVDLQEVTSLTSLFSRFLRSPRVQGAIRYESPYWRSLAAIRIQRSWRYWRKRLR